MDVNDRILVKKTSRGKYFAVLIPATVHYQMDDCTMMLYPPFTNPRVSKLTPLGTAVTAALIANKFLREHLSGLGSASLTVEKDDVYRDGVWWVCQLSWRLD